MHGATGSSASMRSGQPGVAAGNWEAGGDQMWTTSGPPITRLDDGTFLVAGLALAEGADAWTLQEIPARTWASGQTRVRRREADSSTRCTTAVRRGRRPARWASRADEPEAFARQRRHALRLAVHRRDRRRHRHVEVDRVEERRPRRDVDDRHTTRSRRAPMARRSRARFIASSGSPTRATGSRPTRSRATAA